MKKLHLPSLRGTIGEWSYFSSVMKVRDIVENNRIITVSESKELFSENINEILQRKLKGSRIGAIKKYLKENKQRFFSSLIVAIHNGNPTWSDVDIEERFKVENEKITDDEAQFIQNKVGILTLSGEEEIFALDGQHRLMGIRAAYNASDADHDFGEEELSLIFVVHNHELKKRTRRLFTVLNKYAEKPKGAELIILDEDDAASINARRLVTGHPVLKQPNALSSSNNGNIPNSDLRSFTTLVTIHKINKILYAKPSAYYTARPPKDELDGLYDQSVLFWDFFFDKFPEVVRFIKGEQNIILKKSLFNRNNTKGGSLLLRPVGQVLFAFVYKEFENGGRNKFKVFENNIKEVDFDLEGKVWRYIYWNGRMLPKNELLKKRILGYLLGEERFEKYITEELEEIYDDYGVEYKKSIKPIVH